MTTGLTYPVIVPISYPSVLSFEYQPAFETEFTKRNRLISPFSSKIRCNREAAERTSLKTLQYQIQAEKFAEYVASII